MRPHWKIVAAVIAAGLLIWATWFGVVLYKHEENLWMRALTPDLGFDLTEEARGLSRFCFDLGFIGQDKAPAPLRWEQFFIREYRPDGPHEYDVPGVSGELRLGQRSCGDFVEEGYYDFVYRPTMRATYLKYPMCGGDADGAPYVDECHPPREWPSK